MGTKLDARVFASASITHERTEHVGHDIGLTEESPALDLDEIVLRAAKEREGLFARRLHAPADR